MSISDQGAPMDEVRKGMQVRDADGEEVGKVEFVKFGDPEAVTPAGQRSQSGGLVSGLADAIGGAEPDVPEQLAARLLRTGYVQIDGKGLFGPDLYLSPDQVARVQDDVVHLTVAKDQLTQES